VPLHAQQTEPVFEIVVPSVARVAAGAFGLLTFTQVRDRPERYGALSFFETIPSRPSWQTSHHA
jgi:hypothetical protein